MKTTLSIIAAACLSGAAYGQSTYGYSPEVQAYGDRMRGDFRSTYVLEQLEELRAQQRRACFENPIPLPDPLVEQERMRIRREIWFRDMLEDCE